MKTCDDFERLISDRLDGPIPSEADRELEEHLKGCASCRRFLESVMQTRQQIQVLPEILVAQSSPVAQKGSSFFQRRLAIPVPIAAALALITISGWIYALGIFDRDDDDRVAPSSFVHSVEVIRVEPVSAVRGSVDSQDSTTTEDVL